MKKICNVVFTISILLLMTAIVIRVNIVESVSKEFIKNKVSNYLITEIKQSLSNLDGKTIDIVIGKVVNSNEFDEIGNIFYKKIFYDITNNTISEIDISNEINNLVNRNLNQIPKGYYTILKDLVNELDFDNIYSNILLGIKSKLGDYINIIKLYSLITSDSMISLLTTLFIFSIIIIMIKNKSFISTINELGMSMFIDGCLMMIILFFLNRLEVGISMIANIKVDLTLYTIMTFLFIIIGFILKDFEIKKRS